MTFLSNILNLIIIINISLLLKGNLFIDETKNNQYNYNVLIRTKRKESNKSLNKSSNIIASLIRSHFKSFENGIEPWDWFNSFFE
ncbi:Hypothetical protein SRAE_2000514900 [Strongyloides ratti]|uniref:Uncharacterized protein n=1 Tax=Strongyloides ratti TaxID=34506 RepID=A0A090LSD2_STRRB|nr:Hypothetical protein SRAE_2000514900 [Strongyloides ratti]CEF70518.1 Hypothetical protein SRAE_2000514900 [Strongyloides ratti]